MSIKLLDIQNEKPFLEKLCNVENVLQMSPVDIPESELTHRLQAAAKKIAVYALCLCISAHNVGYWYLSWTMDWTGNERQKELHFAEISILLFHIRKVFRYLINQKQIQTKQTNKQNPHKYRYSVLY